MRRFRSLLYEAILNFQRDRASRLAAALAYYTVFSLAPLLVITVAVAGHVLGEQAVQGELVAEIRNATGEDTARFIQNLLARTSRSPSGGITAVVGGLIVLLYGATQVLVQLKDALNTVWKVPPAERSPVRGFLLDRLIGALMVLLIGALLIAAILANAVAATVLQWSSHWLALPGPVLFVLNTMLLTLFTTVFFALLYKILPDCVIRWRAVWFGSFLAAILYAVAQMLLGLYISSSAMTTTYGAAAAVVVILLWVNFSAQILLLGAELVQVFTAAAGGEILELRGARSLWAKILPFDRAARMPGAVRRTHRTR